MKLSLSHNVCIVHMYSTELLASIMLSVIVKICFCVLLINRNTVECC